MSESDLFIQNSRGRSTLRIAPGNINASIASGGVLSGLHGANYYLFFLALMIGATALFCAVFYQKITGR